MLTAGDGTIPVPLEKHHYAPGKFGTGYYFEVPQQNQLPPAMADVEKDISGFVALPNAGIDSVVTDTEFGRRALSVLLPGRGRRPFATVSRSR